METNFVFGVIVLKEMYKKPTVTNDESGRNVFPAVLKAFASGVTMGLARGKTEIDSTHTQTINRRVHSKAV